MPHVTTVVIGAGQAGLAMSRCLSDLGIDHVVIERGCPAERWRSQSWDSLHLLTPNWMTRLPGFQYDGGDPHGFMSVQELVASFDRYAAIVHAPVVADTAVRRVEQTRARFRIATDRDRWSADAVVIATGYCDVPAVPDASSRLAPSITQVVPPDYRRPSQLPDGGVLIVGASATGVQLAEEIQQSRRQVTLAVGRHTRLPRRYRGHDILWWLDQLGVLAQATDTVHAIEVSRRQPSLQLVGRSDGASVDLGTLAEQGVRIVGRLRDIDGHAIGLEDDLIASTAAADIKMAEIRLRIDRFIAATDLRASEPEPFRPTWTIAAEATDRLDLKSEGA